MNHQRLCVLVVLAGALAALPFNGFAQQTASIRGIVQDGSGAVVGGADVQATNVATGQTLQTVTTLSGIYVLGNVPVGSYRVEATLDGFKRFVRDSVSVNTATATDVNIVLEIGDVTESVTIEGTAAPLLRTDNAELSTVMERKLMIDLPLGLSGKSTGAGASGRREIGQFTFLTPGVSGGRGWNRHILGAPQFTGQDIIDGVPFTLLESPGLTDRMGPPFESVQEFKVSTTMYPANLGRGVGITNYTLRSGTNQFHGNAFWFFRNDQLDASGFFNPTRPVVRQNEYGGNVGGPIRKNKTFFHFSWQGFKRRGGTGTLGLLTIPNTEFRQGDFAALTDPGGNLIPIFDGNSTQPDGAGSFVRDAFANNRIPSSRIDPIAGRVMGMLPQPDRAGIVDNWVNRSSNPTDDDSFALKFDHAISDNHRLSGSWWYSNLRIFRYSAWGNHPLDTGIRTPTQTWSLRVNYDWVVTPTLLNHLSWGYSNFRIPRTGNVLHEGNVLGVPGLPDDIVVLPSFRPSGYLAMGNAGAGPEFRINPTTIISDTATWTRGKHQIMFGGEVWLQNNTRRVNAWEAGRFDFRNTASSLPNSPNFSRWGDGLASMLQGDVFQGLRLIGPITGLYEGDYMAWYVEDKIQITPKFTASLGLRYEIARPVREAGNVMSAMDLRLANPAAGGIPGAYVFGNDPIVPATDMTNWGPRIGLAYSVNDKTVIRTGIGIVYTQSNFVNSGVVVGQPELKLGYVEFDSPRTLDNGISPAFKLQSGFPPFTGQLPNLDPGIGLRSTAEWVNPDGARPPYTINWNFNIQRELIAGIVADVAYVGVRGHRMAVQPAQLEPGSDGLPSTRPTAAQALQRSRGRCGRHFRPVPRLRRLGRAGAATVPAVQQNRREGASGGEQHVPLDAGQDREAVLQGHRIPDDLHDVEEHQRHQRQRLVDPGPQPDGCGERVSGEVHIPDRQDAHFGGQLDLRTPVRKGRDKRCWKADARLGGRIHDLLRKRTASENSWWTASSAVQRPQPAQSSGGCLAQDRREQGGHRPGAGPVPQHRRICAAPPRSRSAMSGGSSLTCVGSRSTGPTFRFRNAPTSPRSAKRSISRSGRSSSISSTRSCFETSRPTSTVLRASGGCAVRQTSRGT